MQTDCQIVVNGLEGPSPVHVGRGLLARLGEIAAGAVKGRRACLVSDSNVGPLHAAAAADSLRAAGFEVVPFEIPAGEDSKQLPVLSAVWGALHAAGITRRDLVVALGGGVVGDLAGFAAASSIGGKTAIDLPFGKNLAGAFHQPAAVVADPDMLRTLPPREFAQGMAEVVKYGCILDADFFAFLEGVGGRTPSGEEVERIIARCAALKADVVNRDEREGGVRMLLNFGHTVGHAVEKALGFGAVPHGEAVAIGMVAAARLGEALGATPAGTAERIGALLRAMRLPTSVADVGEAARDPERLFGAMLSDKKKLGAELHFVLLDRIGAARAVPLAPERVRALLPAAL